MFQGRTFDILIQEKLDYIQELARQRGFVIDTRIASMIYFALAANSVETVQAYIELDQVLNETFADTATHDFLVRRARERGIFIEPATFAIRKGEFNIDIPIGSRFSLNRLNYIAVERISMGVFQMRCETAGNIGNLENGNLIPINYINGLTRAVLTDVLIPGEDEESTEHLRQRYFDSLNSQAYGGNVQDYVEKVMKIDGVRGGGCKIYPAWNGGGTVKVVFLNSQYQIPSTILVDAVQATLDPIPNNGQGLGVAPIGHWVTVEGVTSETIDISSHVTLEIGLTWEAVEPFIRQAIDNYFLELAREWDKVAWRDDPTATLIIRVSQIETRILSVSGVLDITNTTLNGQAVNVTLGVDSIPIRGDISNV